MLRYLLRLSFVGVYRLSRPIFLLAKLFTTTEADEFYNYGPSREKGPYGNCEKYRFWSACAVHGPNFSRFADCLCIMG